jgi:Zn-dependent protease with chaperone function
VWVLSAVATSVGSPRILSTMTRRGVSAGIGLALWAVLVCATLLILGAPVLAEAMSRCADLLGAGEHARPDAVAAVLSGAILSIAAVRATWRLRSAGLARRRVHRHHLGVGRILQGAHAAEGSVLWLPLDVPTAYSVSGRPPLVVASTALRACLDADALAGVLAHERAHIARRHHTLVGAAEAVAAGLPWLPLMRRSPALVRTLVEFDADDHAARALGPEGLQRALQTLRPILAPTPTLAITGDAVDMRLSRLVNYPTSTGPIANTLTSLTVVLLPVLTMATTSVLVTVIASCTAI